MTKQIFNQQKFKKFGTLKYKSKTTVKTKNFTEGNKLLEKAPTTERLTYAEILKAAKNPSIRTSKTSLTIMKPIKAYTKNYLH